METTPTPTPEKSKSSAKTIIVIVALAILGFFGYKHYSESCSMNETAKDSVATAPIVVAPAMPAADTAKKVVVDTVKAK